MTAANILLASLVPLAFDFKQFRHQCELNNFCNVLRPMRSPVPPSFHLEPSSIEVVDGNVVRARVTQPELGPNSSALLLLRATADDHGAPSWRMQLLKASGSNSFTVSRLVLPETQAAPITYLNKGLAAAQTADRQAHIFRAEGGDGSWSEVELSVAPFSLRVFVGITPMPRAAGATPALVFNGFGRLRFAKSEGLLSNPSSPAAEALAKCAAADGQREGCTAVAADVAFPGAIEGYGLPERPVDLALRQTFLSDDSLQPAGAKRASSVGVTVSPTGQTVASSAGHRHANDQHAVDDGIARQYDAARRMVEQPYRLYNLDVFKYTSEVSMGLYGSLPFLLAQGAGTAAGALWLNAADTYVDLWAAKDIAEMRRDSVGDGEDASNELCTTWLSEGGALEMLFFGGPTAAQVLRQLHLATGRPPMPPLWSLGYHQSHWNIKTQGQVLSLDRNFDQHGVPLDAVWLDIEHTDGKQYFTWDQSSFPSPEEMPSQLHPKGRRLVAIADPHLKAEGEAYDLHARAKGAGWLVASAKNKTLVGKCWPGKSTYLDVFNPEARNYWRSLYAKGPRKEGTGEGSRLGWPLWLHAWNDMNEPSVFESEELTMPRNANHRVGGDTYALDAMAIAARDAIIAGVVTETEMDRPVAGGSGPAWEAPSLIGRVDMVDVEHRVVHNAYGAMQVSATHAGLMDRTSHTERPFLLSRSFFVGSQRFGAVWTGDNTASWQQLQLSISMVLTLALSGHSFAGADVGGFFGTPPPELLTRWYQAAAYLPFFRGHAHIDEPRREPYLMPRTFATAAIEAINERQRLLPYWATLWYRAADTDGGLGLPVVAPPWFHFPPAPLGAGGGSGGVAVEELRAHDQWMVGDALLVQPIMSSKHAFAAGSVDVRLPSAPALWYALCEGARLDGAYRGDTTVQLPSSLASTPRFQRGGTILPRRERVRRSSLVALRDPLTLHVAPDAGLNANGQVFLDDGLSTPRAQGSTAVLLDIRFSCTAPRDVQAGVSRANAGTTARHQCELHAQSTTLWGDVPSGDGAASLPFSNHIEAVLIRGVSLPEGTSVTLASDVALSAAGVTAERNEKGLLLRGMAASTTRDWSLRFSMPLGYSWDEVLSPLHG